MTIDWKDIITTTLDRWNGRKNVELRVVKTQEYGIDSRNPDRVIVWLKTEHSETSAKTVAAFDFENNQAEIWTHREKTYQHKTGMEDLRPWFSLVRRAAKSHMCVLRRRRGFRSGSATILDNIR